MDCSELAFQRRDSQKQGIVPMGHDVFKYKDVNEVQTKLQELGAILNIDGNQDIYWVDTKIIERLRPKK